MTIQTHKLASSAAITIGISYIICASLMHIWPKIMLQLMAELMHMSSLEIIEPYFQVTLKNFISGILQSIIYTYFFVALWGTLYNRYSFR